MNIALKQQLFMDTIKILKTEKKKIGKDKLHHIIINQIKIIFSPGAKVKKKLPNQIFFQTGKKILRVIVELAMKYRIYFFHTKCRQSLDLLQILIQHLTQQHYSLTLVKCCKNSFNFETLFFAIQHLSHQPAPPASDQVLVQCAGLKTTK